MSAPRKTLLMTAALLLAACGTTQTHYYTLLPTLAGKAAVDGTTPPSAPLIDLPSVRVPVQLDQRNLVVRLRGNEVAPVESRRWLAPLPDEIASALRADLQRRVSASPSTPSAVALRYRVVVDVTRFDGWLGQRLDLAAQWTLIESRADAPADHRKWTCSTTLTQSLASGYPALVNGAQLAVDQLAVPIAALITAAANSQAALNCP